MSDFDILGIASSGMQAQRAALDVAARNVALAQTADAAHPYHPLAAQFQAVKTSFDRGDDDFPGEDEFDNVGDDEATESSAVRFVGTQTSAKGETGLDAVTEMVGVLNAQRAYETNVSIFDEGKRLNSKTIDMGNG